MGEREGGKRTAAAPFIAPGCNISIPKYVPLLPYCYTLQILLNTERRRDNAVTGSHLVKEQNREFFSCPTTGGDRSDTRRMIFYRPHFRYRATTGLRTAPAGKERIKRAKPKKKKHEKVKRKHEDERKGRLSCLSFNAQLLLCCTDGCQGCGAGLTREEGGL